MRALALAALAGAALGCASHPQAGAYLCATDDACPGALSCTCGQCVERETQAACGFSVEPQLPAGRTLEEYERFELAVTARTAGGAIATEYTGTVSLSFELADGSPWGAAAPGEVRLEHGAGAARAFVNRETIPPQGPHLVARAAAIHGESAPFAVVPAPLGKDAAPVIAPVGAAAPFGWANFSVSEPAAFVSSRGPRLYYTARAKGPGASDPVLPSIGVTGLGAGCQTVAGPCTPDAGAPPVKLLTPRAGTFYSLHVGAPAPLLDGDGVSVAFNGADEQRLTVGIARQLGDGPLELANHGDPILKTTDCPGYCAGAQLFSPGLLRTSTGEAQLFFSVLTFAADPTQAPRVAIGRATSADLATFTPEPAPLLNGEVGGESVLSGARVLLDRGVYKMWYTYSHEFVGGCAARWTIGYATSIDGLYWIRSPSNPVLSAGGAAWEVGSNAVQLGSVVPLDGVDPANGLAVYYAAFPPPCAVNGVGRAVAPARR